ncbi:MAG: BrnT family toxin [Spirochaetia bacterium]|nr:BrnT family toxin [Spirochaetia bacterium]
MEFQWDSLKDQANIKKHGISFEEASELFELLYNLILELYDYEHGLNEDRFISIGPIKRGMIVVVSVERDEGNVIRLISAGFAKKTEQQRC